MADILIRNCTIEEMPLLCEFSKYGGRNPGLNDANFLFPFDPGGFFIAIHENTIVGSISAVSMGSKYGFIGYHLTDPNYLEHRISQKMLDIAKQKLSKLCIGLNCFESQAEFYGNAGFETAYRIDTWSCAASSLRRLSNRTVSPLLYSPDFIRATLIRYFPQEIAN